MSRLSKFVSDTARFGALAAVIVQCSRFSDKLIKIKLRDVGEMSFRGKNSDFGTIRQVFGRREYDIRNDAVARRMQSRYAEILAAGREPIIIDAGANIGAASRWFCALWPEAHILALEPEHGAAAMLKLNTDEFDRIEVFEAAIGSQTGFVTMSTPIESQSVGSRAMRSEKGTAVMTVRDLLNHVPNAELFIVKIDIEGFEEDLFAANVDWLDLAECIMIEPHDWLFPGRATSRNFQREIGARPFQLFIEDENLIYVRHPYDSRPGPELPVKGSAK
jgi:FkbM family methyltransferase